MSDVRGGGGRGCMISAGHAFVTHSKVKGQRVERSRTSCYHVGCGYSVKLAYNGCHGISIFLVFVDSWLLYLGHFILG